MNNLLTARAITKNYTDGKVSASVLHGVDLDIAIGEQIAIVGSSGSGKSTLLHILGALDDPTSGQVMINGVDVHTLNEEKRAIFRNQNLGFVYQFHHLLGEFDALENVMMPLLMQKTPPNQARDLAGDMLARVGLSARMTHRPSELSGGERQRVAIARALVGRPKLLLADEPTGNLDQKSAQMVFDLLLKMQEDSTTAMVLVTHDERLAQKTQRTLRLQDGVWV